jgi:hypothetical protein
MKKMKPRVTGGMNTLLLRLNIRMTTPTLTYEYLKEKSSGLGEKVIEVMPLMTNRKIFRPEFDIALIQPPTPAEATDGVIARALVSIIEDIGAFGGRTRRHTYSFFYTIKPDGFVWPCKETFGNGMLPYKYPVELWVDGLIEELKAPAKQKN